MNFQPQTIIMFLANNQSITIITCMKEDKQKQPRMCYYNHVLKYKHIAQTVTKHYLFLSRDNILTTQILTKSYCTSIISSYNTYSGPGLRVVSSDQSKKLSLSLFPLWRQADESTEGDWETEEDRVMVSMSLRKSYIRRVVQGQLSGRGRERKKDRDSGNGKGKINADRSLKKRNTEQNQQRSCAKSDYRSEENKNKAHILKPDIGMDSWKEVSLYADTVCRRCEGCVFDTSWQVATSTVGWCHLSVFFSQHILLLLWLSVSPV